MQRVDRQNRKQSDNYYKGNTELVPQKQCSLGKKNRYQSWPSKDELKVSEKRQVETISRKVTCAKAQIQERAWSSRKLTSVGVCGSKQAVETAGVSDGGGGRTLHTMLRSFALHRDVSGTSVCPMHRSWGLGVWSRERFIAGPRKERGLMPEKSQTADELP